MGWKPDICIYHFPCDDGFGAAWAVWKKWGDDVEYCPKNYGMLPPDVAGKNVLICDFSFPPDVLHGMGESAKSIIILDHHKTAEEDLAGIPRIGEDSNHPDLTWILPADYVGIAAWFDMEKSGARLTWEFCHGFNSKVPELIKYIEDRDLWRFNYPETKIFSLLLRSLPLEFDVWENYAEDLENPARSALLWAEAKGIQRFYDLKVTEICETAVEKEIGGHLVPVVNAPYFMASDVGNELAKDKLFAAIWCETYGGRSYSLRSAEDGLDVSEIARKFGGAGHKHAAGFRVPA